MDKGWINIKEMEPPMVSDEYYGRMYSSQVLGAVDGRVLPFFVKFCCQGGFVKADLSEGMCPSDYDFGEVTHWMPAPEPPK